MAHSAITVANRFLEKAGPAGLSPMQILKLTYLAQGWMLGLYGEPLTWDDAEAWKYGPVFRNIYGLVAGKTTIHSRLPGLVFTKPHNDAALESREENLINQVWQKYGKLSGLQLSALTHTHGSPWEVTYKQHGQNAVIPKDLIREYYAKIAA